MKRTIFLTAFFTFFAAVTGAQDLGALDRTETGKRALGYFAAFNSGDDSKLATYFGENIDPEFLKKRPVEPRVQFHKQVRSDLKKLEAKRIASITQSEIKVLAQAASGEWAQVTFEIEPSGKFAVVSVERIDPPAEPRPVPQAPASMAEFIPAVRTLFDGLAKDDLFSGVVLIAKDDTVLFEKAYGYAERDKRSANNIDTRFNLGSINKIFTTVAIGQLVAQGKLAYDDKLIKVLPDYPNRAVAEKITIGQLISMRSGMGDFFGEKFMAADKSKIRSLKDYLPFFVNDALLFEPGTNRRYSNAGYMVLGLVIEKLTGKTYYDYVRENVFKPAGMTSTDSYAMDELPSNTAIGYMDAKRVPNTNEQPARGSSAGGGYSNVHDMLRFVTALRSQKLNIPDEKGNVPAAFAGAQFAGGSPGVNAIFFARATNTYTIIVLSNYDPPTAEKPATLVRDWLNQLTQ